MTKNSENVGKIGELLVSRHLEGLGHSVISRNYRKKWGEIDIITKHNETIHFVEVKTVSRERMDFFDSGYSPEENVHPEKLKRMYRTIQSYLMEEKIPEDASWQVDVAGVLLNLEGKKARIRITENIIG